jgi:hydroxyacylglutathione hydrolase
MNIHILTSSDNFIYVIEHDQHACVVDPSAAAPVLMFLDTLDMHASLILNTHNHFDHTGGNQAIQNKTQCEIASNNPSTPGNIRLISDQDTIAFANLSIQAIATPGHTKDSFCFYIPGTPGVLFTGDTLFVGGCGSLLGGTAAQLWNSLQRLANLPEDTLVYCGHEYAQDNYAFAAHIESRNQFIQQRWNEIDKLRKAGKPTIPSTIGQEKSSNLFMRAESVESFAELRKKKDGF